MNGVVHMRETQKQKIARLEAEITALKAQNEQLYIELLKAKDEADNGFMASPCYRQMKSEIQLLRRQSNVQKSKNERGSGRKPKLSDAQREQVTIMHARGKTIRELAKYFDVSVGTISNAIHAK